MSNKCEWKEELVDGSSGKYVKTGLVFCPCDNFEPSVGMKNNDEDGSQLFYPSCNECHADIRKPDDLDTTKGITVKACTSDTGCINSWTCKTCPFYKPKPLIMRSGETWIKYENGMNYLCVNPYNYNNGFKTPDNWKSFTGSNPDITELTDEIAKLRPIITHPCRKYLLKLYGINSLWKGDWTVLLYDSTENKSLIVTLKNLRIATAKELQEAEK